ncbi:MAG: hypothetical protein ACFN4D_01015, partial [Cardiobacterium sp.]
MPRPLFAANRQSANTLIWRRFDLFRRWRLLTWLIAAPIGYGYTATLLALYAKNLGGGTAWLAWYPLIYTAVLALVCHRSLIRLLWNPPILVCDENGLTAFNEYGRWLGQWQWAQIAELRATLEPGDYYALEVIMHGDTPPRPAPDETVPAHDLARYGQSYLPAADNPPAADAPCERLPLPELGPDLPQILDDIRRHRERAPLDTPRAETRAWYKHPRSIQRDNWRLFGWLAAALVATPLLTAQLLRGGIAVAVPVLPVALYGLGCFVLLLRPGWHALRRLIADPARPVARIDGNGITIRDGATRLRLSWRDLRRIENDDGVLVLTDYRDRHYRTLRAAGNNDTSIDAIITASRAMRDGEPLPDDTPLPPPRRRPLAWLLLANSLLLPASLTLLYLSRAPRETGLTLLALLAIAALAWWARQSHWQTQATYREPLPATPPAPRPDLPVRQWYRAPRAIARANWLGWWLLLPASILAQHLPNLWMHGSRNAALTFSLITAILALGAARLLWRTFACATRPIARSDADGLHLALTKARQRDFHHIYLYGNLGGGKLNFTMPWAELDHIRNYRYERSVNELLILTNRDGDHRNIRTNAAGGAVIARNIAHVVGASLAHYNAIARPIEYDDPEFLDFMERSLRGELPDGIDPDSELAAELRAMNEKMQPPPEIAAYILADIARRRAARSAKNIPPANSRPLRIRPRAWALLATNLTVATALPILHTLYNTSVFWPLLVLTLLNLAAWRGDEQQQATLAPESRPASPQARPNTATRRDARMTAPTAAPQARTNITPRVWYKPAHLVARANGRACAWLILLMTLAAPFADALIHGYSGLILFLVAPVALIARSLWRELHYAFSASDQPVARIDADGLHLAARGKRLHPGAPGLHIPWDDLADIDAVPYDAPPRRFATPEHLAIYYHNGDERHIRTALLDDYPTVRDIAASASGNPSPTPPRPEPPPPALPSPFARRLMVANLAFAALWLTVNILLQQHLLALPFTEPPLP